MSKPPTQPFRLADGGAIDRARVLAFSFDGVACSGHPGDTLASALLANGVRLVGRSFKYHRPRGIAAAGADEPNALVQLEGELDEPNVRATTLPLFDGLVASSQNRWPSLAHDLGALNSLIAPLIPAGFYYKTFHRWPGAWNVFGPIIRRMAGLGRAPLRDGPERYEKRFGHADVLVIGAGPAGLAAALAAARAGARTMLVDDEPQPGGTLLDERSVIDGRDAREWLCETVAELDAMPRVKRLAATSAFGYYDHDMVALLERVSDHPRLHERLWKVRARQVVLATGAGERPLVFADNDRPGVMLAGAARRYARRHGVLPGRRAVLVANHSGAYRSVFDLADDGLRVAAIVDVRAAPPATLVREAAARGIELLPAHTVTGVAGRHCVRAVHVAPRDGCGRGRTMACDLLLVSGGWSPLVHLASQSGARPVWDAARVCFVPGTPVQNERSAGAAAGVFDLGGCLASGARAGAQAADAAGFAPQAAMAPVVAPELPPDIEACFELPGQRRGAKAFVDFQNDVTTDDLRLAHREGFRSVEHVKRYTTAGMGTDQGKLGNVNVIGILAALEDCAPGAIGTTGYRPPYQPVSFGAIAGNDFESLVLPSRRSVISHWNERHGARMFEAGLQWRRPACYPRPGEDDATAIAREVRTCRDAAGLYDASPLGKLELAGADAATFLNRVVTCRVDDLAVGEGRFGWMLREEGRLLDDGVTFRLGERRFLHTCGTGMAEFVHAHLERLAQLEWPQLRVFIGIVSAQWATLAVCGPRTREVLAAAGTDVALDNDAFPFMQLREGNVAGLPARIARLSYTGELGFEVSVRTRHGLTLWEALFAAGQAHGITPVGSEASMVMRCEKGFVSAGYEGDGIVNPYDAGQGWTIDTGKGDFVGRRMLARDRAVGGVRPQVVGLLPEDPGAVPPDGTPIVAGDTHPPEVIGYVTQGVLSPSLGRAIALAVLDDGRTRIGSQVTLAATSGRGAALVTRPCFLDPAGTRMRS